MLDRPTVPASTPPDVPLRTGSVRTAVCVVPVVVPVDAGMVDARTVKPMLHPRSPCVDGDGGSDQECEQGERRTDAVAERGHQSM